MVEKHAKENGWWRQIVPLEPSATWEAGRGDLLRADLVDLEREGVALHQIPGVAGKLPLDVGDDPRGPEETDHPIAAEDDPQQVIESNEVIDVGVRDEDIGDLQQVGWRLRRKVTKVHQERT